MNTLSSDKLLLSMVASWRQHLTQRYCEGCHHTTAPWNLGVAVYDKHRVFLGWSSISYTSWNWNTI